MQITICWMKLKPFSRKCRFNMPEKLVDFWLKRIPEGLKRQINIIAAEQGRTIKSVLMEALADIIKKYKHKP